jgi:hypothetical protein
MIEAHPLRKIKVEDGGATYEHKITIGLEHTHRFFCTHHFPGCANPHPASRQIREYT